MKRKYSWTIEFRKKNTWEIIIPMGVVKVQRRPDLVLEHTVLNSCGNSNQLYVPGKAYYDTLTFTYYDIEDNEGAYFFMRYMENVYSKLDLGTYQFQLLCATLTLYDNLSNPVEMWCLDDVVFTSYRSDASQGDETQLEVEMSYQDSTHIDMRQEWGVSPISRATKDKFWELFGNMKLPWPTGLFSP